MMPSPEQAAILEGIVSGPARIDAGAGTGKTFTLVAAIGALVDRGIAPERLLGVTFTNKAAGELAARVRERIGSDVDLGVEADIHTYHGFAARLLREFGPFVGVERDTRVITPTFARQLLSEAIGAVGPLDALDLTTPRQRLLGDLGRLASSTADNLVDPASLITDDPEDPVVAQRSDLARVLVRFRAEKRRIGVVDYADLIAFAHELVSEHPTVAQRVAERYDAVFLDEYQDTDPAQRLLLQRLFADGRPVVAVGDGDQTIYEWRGASLENFAAFPVHFPTAAGAPAPTFPLTSNRRSGTSILDVANALRSRASADSAQLVAPPGTPDGRVTAGWYRTAVDEAAAIADEVAAHAAAGIAYADMAVLTRANHDIGLIRAGLADAGIPTEVVSLGGLLDVPEIVEVHAWLRLLDDPTDSIAFARLALGSRGRLGLGDLRPLAEWVRIGRDDDGLGRGFMEALDRLEEIDVRPEARAALARLAGTVAGLLPVAQGLSLVELVREVLSRIDAWRDVEALPPAAALSTRLNLYRFLDLAEQWSPLEGRPSLQAFLDHLELLREDPTEELDTARVSGENAVALLTAHRAKGLEWDVVFVPTLSSGKFPTPPRAFEDPYERPWVLPHDRRLDRASLPLLDPTDRDARRAVLRERHALGEWRLAYVAATRARRHLHLSGAAWYGVPEPTKRPRSASEIMEAVWDLACVEVVANQDPGDRPPQLLAPTTSPAPDPLFPAGWDDAIRRAIADHTLPSELARELGIGPSYDAKVSEFQEMLFSLPDPPVAEVDDGPLTVSVSGLVTHARCPAQYRWTFVDPLPRRANPAAARGVAVHRRIELHNLGHLPLDDADEAVYDVVDGGVGGRSAYATYLASRFAETRPLAVEAPFELPIGGAEVRGRIDAIYGDGNGWEIVDFKSGRPSQDPALDRQLDAYAVAVADGRLGPAPQDLAVTFAYLGDGLVEHTRRIDGAELVSARRRLEATIADIASGTFEPQPSTACTRCDFLVACEAGRLHVATSADDPT